MLYELISKHKATVDPRAFRGGINMNSSSESIQVDDGDPHPGITLETVTGLVHITPKRVKPCAADLQLLKEDGVIRDYRYIDQGNATMLVVEF